MTLIQRLNNGRRLNSDKTNSITWMVRRMSLLKCWLMAADDENVLKLTRCRRWEEGESPPEGLVPAVRTAFFFISNDDWCFNLWWKDAMDASSKTSLVPKDAELKQVVSKATAETFAQWRMRWMSPSDDSVALIKSPTSVACHRLVHRCRRRPLLFNASSQLSINIDWNSSPLLFDWLFIIE